MAGELKELFVVREYDYHDNQWIDITGPVSKEEAEKVWSQKTCNGTMKTKYADKIYYHIFPANTKMLYSDGFMEI